MLPSAAGWAQLAPIVLTPCDICCDESSQTNKCNICDLRICRMCIGRHSHRGAEITLPNPICYDSPMRLSPSIDVILMLCSNHPNETVTEFCDSCAVTLCNYCDRQQHATHNVTSITEAAEMALTKCNLLKKDALNTAKAAEFATNLTDMMINQCFSKAETALMQINASFSYIEKAVRDRKRDLISKVECMKTTKVNCLKIQNKQLNYVTRSSYKIYNHLNSATNSELKDVMIRNYTESLKDFHKINCLEILVLPVDSFIFEIPLYALCQTLSTMGSMNSPTFYMLNLSEKTKCNVRLPIEYGLDVEIASNGQDRISNNLRGVENILSLDEESSGSSDLWSLVTSVGVVQPVMQYDLDSIKRLLLVGRCAIMPLMKMYENIPVVFGEQGSGNGQFCRPWGVCCDLDDNIIVADRSNNRIQVFKNDGRFLRKFGRQGSEPGNFDRPAGVTSDSACNIIVADKDNHRIQIFTKLGVFLFTFGERGSSNGQFNYPWDVDVNCNGLILVSDTRNHRVQLFTRDGKFIAKYGFETANMWRQFDSPRGVCFTPDGGIAVTDFNNHRVVKLERFANSGVVPKDGQRLIGSEGTSRNQFYRPQGIAVNSEGYLIVADSRNNRIHLLDQRGNFLFQLSEAGEQVGHLNRPCGICVNKENKIIVVDFGNNRIQIFH